MNILPHKSWHVYNKQNIEKVKRDEAKAKEEEDRKAKRAQKAESEARLALLRQRASLTSSSTSTPSASAKVETFRLFEDAERADKEYGQNEEYVAEQKEKEAKWERQVTMYLDNSVKEKAPWYAQKDHDRFGEDIPKRFDKKSTHSKRKRESLKIQADPLEVIEAEMSRRKEREKKKTGYVDSTRHTKKTSDKHNATKSSSPSIEALRAQRLERERAEREKAYRLLHGEPSDDMLSDRNRQYNSQFNRDETALAKKQRRR